MRNFTSTIKVDVLILHYDHRKMISDELNCSKKIPYNLIALMNKIQNAHSEMNAYNEDSFEVLLHYCESLEVFIKTVSAGTERHDFFDILFSLTFLREVYLHKPLSFLFSQLKSNNKK